MTRRCLHGCCWTDSLYGLCSKCSGDDFSDLVMVDVDTLMATDIKKKARIKQINRYNQAQRKSS
jgi:hypothetical protein